MDRWFARTYPALVNRDYRVLWLGSFLAFAAFFMSTVVQAVVAFELTGNNSSVGVVVFGQGLAQLLLGPFGGALADRVSKRKMIGYCQAAIGAVFFILAVLVATDTVTILFLAIGSFVTGMSFSFLGPARQAFVVQLVGVEMRPNAVALNQVALNGARVIGPALGGFALSLTFIGAAGAYLIMGLAYILVVGSLFLLPPSLQAPPNGRSVLGDLFDGVRYVAGEPRLRALVLFFIFVMMVGFPYVTVLPGLLENEFDQSASSVGIISAFVAAGAFAASLVVAPMVGSKRAPMLYSALGLGFGVSLILMGLTPTYLLVFIPALLLGIASGGFQTLNGAVIVSETDPAYFGRVLSLQMLAFAGFGLMALPLGLLADAAGERTTLICMGSVVSVVVIVFTILVARSRPTAASAAASRTPALAKDRIR